MKKPKSFFCQSKNCLNQKKPCRGNNAKKSKQANKSTKTKTFNFLKLGFLKSQNLRFRHPGHVSGLYARREKLKN